MRPILNRLLAIAFVVLMATVGQFSELARADTATSEKLPTVGQFSELAHADTATSEKSPTVGQFSKLARADAATSPKSPTADVIVGLEGHYRVGCWTALRVTTDQGGAETSSSIETRDGDGVRVAYQQTTPLKKGTWGYVIPGSEAAPLIVRGDSQVLLSTRFPTLGSPSRGASMIPLTMPWIVAIGDPLGIDKIGANELLRRDALMAVSMPQSAAGFPDSPLGYDGVDLMLIGGSSRPILASLNENQRQAIVQWVTSGGRVFLTAGESSPQLLEDAPWLLELLPITDEDLTTNKLDPAALESFASSQSPLDPFVGIKLPKKQGRVLITGRTTRRVSAPIAAEYVAGLGRVTVVAADLENEMFARWPERLDLITRLTGSILIPQKQEATRQSRATAYNDLAGQTRATLDRFDLKRSFGFSVLSLILMGLIAVIGPLDYLLINRVFGRPLLGWLSFPLTAIGLAVILVQQSGPVVASIKTGPADDSLIRCNRMEFVDMDLISKRGRGCSLSYLYSHPASLMDVNVDRSPSLEAISQRVDQMFTTPFGYPGEAFGGIQIAIEDARLPTYQVSIDDSGDHLHGSLRGLPLAPRSSKFIATTYQIEPSLTSPTLTRRPGSQMLQGELVNPLPIDLLDGMLVFQSGVYLLPTRFPAGAKTAFEEIRDKPFRWQLSRQKALEENATESETWNPARNDSPERIAEMLMFHKAVGGTRYTSLQHDPLSLLDLSDLLADDRCILVGRLAEPVTSLTTQLSGNTAQPVPGNTLTMIRLILPVAVKGR